MPLLPRRRPLPPRRPADAGKATYKRVVRLSSKFKAHDEENAARVGDTVRIEESRPLSREKRWRVIEVVARGSYEELVD